MKKEKTITDKLASLKLERDELIQELENDKEFGTSRECFDSDIGELNGKIKILEWILK